MDTIIPHSAPKGKEVAVIQAIDSITDTKVFNTFSILSVKLGGTQKYFQSNDTLSLVKKFNSNIVKASRAVVRLGTYRRDGTDQIMLSTLGTAFLLSPTRLVTNRHVTLPGNTIPLAYGLLKGQWVDTAIFKNLSNDSAVTFLNPNKSRIDLKEFEHRCQNEVDPILGTGREMGKIPFDCEFLNLLQEQRQSLFKNKNADNPYLFPSPSKVQVGDYVAVIAYHGNPQESIEDFVTRTYGHHPTAPSKEELSDAFFAFDKLLVSIGKVICHYGEVGDEWIPVDSENNLYIPNTCSTLSGSSGGVMILLKENEPAGAFIGFHIGGNFIPCKACLKVIPSQRSHVYESKNLAVCESCQSNSASYTDHNNTLAFNLGMSVHHPAFKTAYKKHILPTIAESERPDFLNQYLNQDE